MNIVGEREIAIIKLNKLHTHDLEADHIEADVILCDLLTSLGCDDVVVAYEKIDKWYA